MLNLEAYRQIVGDKVINEIYHKAKKFKNKNIVCISSTSQGGGVAEMLNSLVFLFNEIGINFGWRIIHGLPAFFEITKEIHNALQGQEIDFTERKKKLYLEINKRFSIFTHLNHDLVIVHDPQPLPLINFYQKRTQSWIFRIHIDISNPNKDVWNYLKNYVGKYDALVVSDKKYKKDISIPQHIIHPAIDPLSRKNKEFDKHKLNKCLKLDLRLDLDIPIISQISRFDKWKDPEGVIKVFEKVKEQTPCQLVLLGNLAPDDPEGIKIYNKLIEEYGNRKDIKIFINVNDNDFVVNALQTISSVIIQKSTKEGFGLTVAESLYKGTPVVASNIGGIPLQIIDGETGFLHNPYDYDAFAESIIKLLKDSQLREEMGRKGKEYITKNFLITKLMLDWLNLFEKYLK